MRTTIFMVHVICITDFKINGENAYIVYYTFCVIFVILKKNSIIPAELHFFICWKYNLLQCTHARMRNFSLVSHHGLNSIAQCNKTIECFMLGNICRFTKYAAICNAYALIQERNLHLLYQNLCLIQWELEHI